MTHNDYVQYGCGLDAPLGWINFDASPTLLSQKIPVLGHLFYRFADTKFPKNVQYGDIIRGLPVKPESCLAMYCSHVLEHLSHHDFGVALHRTYSYLKKGGTFRLVVPDLEYIARTYLRSTESNACSKFIEACSLGKHIRHRSLAKFLREWLRNDIHLWMWDFKGIEHELKAVGFQKIRRASYHDSEIQQFREVEHQVRWENAVGIECVKR